MRSRGLMAGRSLSHVPCLWTLREGEGLHPTLKASPWQFPKFLWKFTQVNNYLFFH